MSGYVLIKISFYSAYINCNLRYNSVPFYGKKNETSKWISNIACASFLVPLAAIYVARPLLWITALLMLPAAQNNFIQIFRLWQHHILHTKTIGHCILWDFNVVFLQTFHLAPRIHSFQCFYFSVQASSTWLSFLLPSSKYLSLGHVVERGCLHPCFVFFQRPASTALGILRRKLHSFLCLFLCKCCTVTD